jgi:hypothetical protein
MKDKYLDHEAFRASQQVALEIREACMSKPTSGWPLLFMVLGCAAFLIWLLLTESGETFVRWLDGGRM